MEQVSTPIFEFCKKIVDLFMSFANNVIDTFQKPLADVLNVVAEIPVIGTLTQNINQFIVWLLTAVDGSPDTDITVVEFMFGEGFALFIAISFVIWVLNIIT